MRGPHGCGFFSRVYSARGELLTKTRFISVARAASAATAIWRRAVGTWISSLGGAWEGIDGWGEKSDCRC